MLKHSQIKLNLILNIKSLTLGSKGKKWKKGDFKHKQENKGAKEETILL